MNNQDLLKELDIYKKALQKEKNPFLKGIIEWKIESTKRELERR